MTFTNIKLDLSHYSTSVFSSGYGSLVLSRVHRTRLRKSLG